VAEIVTHQQMRDLTVPTSDTGDYCRARAKLSETALHDLTVEIGEELEEQAEPIWLWKGEEKGSAKKRGHSEEKGSGAKLAKWAT
jgi:hypothetical protein